MNKKIGLALGGGGVKGLAHIALLKWMDQQGITPAIIVGTSMGAIIGALYASGLSGQEIEDRVKSHIIVPGEKPKQWLKKSKQLIKWAKIFSFKSDRGGFMTADGLFEHLFSELNELEFSDLKIPFKAIATNFYTAEEVVMDEGNLLSAVLASMAVPGVFAPVTRNNAYLIDGGTVNNLPCDKIREGTEVRIASDVICLSRHEQPRTTQVIAGAINIFLTAATRERLQRYPVDLLFQPDTSGIDAFDFLKMAEALRRGDIAAQQLRDQGQLFT